MLLSIVIGNSLAHPKLSTTKSKNHHIFTNKSPDNLQLTCSQVHGKILVSLVRPFVYQLREGKSLVIAHTTFRSVGM